MRPPRSMLQALVGISPALDTVQYDPALRDMAARRRAQQQAEQQQAQQAIREQQEQAAQATAAARAQEEAAEMQRLREIHALGQTPEGVDYDPLMIRLLQQANAASAPMQAPPPPDTSAYEALSRIGLTRAANSFDPNVDQQGLQQFMLGEQMRQRALAAAAAPAASNPQQAEALKQIRMILKSKSSDDLARQKIRNQQYQWAAPMAAEYRKDISSLRAIEKLTDTAKRMGFAGSEKGVRGTLAGAFRNLVTLKDLALNATGAERVVLNDKFDLYRAQVLEVTQRLFAEIRPPGQQSNYELEGLLRSAALSANWELPSTDVVMREIAHLGNQLRDRVEGNREVLAGVDDPRIARIIGITGEDIRKLTPEDLLDRSRYVDPQTGEPQAAGQGGSPSGAFQATASPLGEVFGVSDGAEAHAGRNSAGVDIRYPEGQPILAPASGTIVRVGSDPKSGNYVKVQTPSGMIDFVHLQNVANVRPGQRVAVGEQIGLSGSTGNVTGPHLHFEVNDGAPPDALVRQMQIMPMTQNIAARVSAQLKTNVPTGLVAAVMRTENSKFDPKAVSHKNARGLMQMLPGTAAEISEELGDTSLYERYMEGDPSAQIYLGTYYLGKLMRMFNNDPVLAVAAYNAGPGRVRAARGVPNIKETLDYVGKVIGMYEGRQ